jgi:hypothetical protein
MRRTLPVILASLAALTIFSCSKKTEDFQSAPLSDYYPLQVGKYVTYRVDSTVFTNFGHNTEIHSYQVKHSIEAQLTDNLGRPAYRVFRYIRDTAGTQPWTPNGSYFITPTGQQIETVENNLRVIKLHLPVKDGFNWHGNTHLPVDAYSTFYSFNNDDVMGLWDFSFTGIDQPLTVNGNSFTKATTVTQVDEKNIPDTITVSNNQLVVPDQSIAVWAKGTGTDTITIVPPTPSSVDNFFHVSNRTTRVMKLNGIVVPVGYNRTYQYRSGKWDFPLDPFTGTPDMSVSSGADYASRNFGVEKFAVNIGLVYREFVMWEFQPTYVGDDGFKVGFGIRMSIIDHN